MAKSATFASVLDTPATAVERPKPLPVGQYVWVVQGQPRFDESSQKKTPFVEFTLKCLSAMDTVDEDALEEWKEKKDGTKRNLQDATQRLTFYLTEDAVYRLKDFMKDCGLDVEDSDETLKQLISQVPGCQVIGTIKHTNSEDGETVYANIKGTAQVE